MNDPDLAWTMAAYLASGGTLPSSGHGRDDAVDLSQEPFGASRSAGGNAFPSGASGHGGYGRRGDVVAVVGALMEAFDDLGFSVRRATLPYPMGEVDLVEADEPGLPMVAVGGGAWLIDGDDTRAVHDDGDLVAAVSREFADTVGERRRSLVM